MRNLRLLFGSLLALIISSALAGHAASLGVASSRLSVFHPTELPSGGCSSPGSQTVYSTADSYVVQDSSNSNFGTATTVRVNAQTGSNQRTLVQFTLPSLPSGCTVTDATLRFYAEAAASSRTIQAFQVSATWTETGVTWINQPAYTGTAVNSTSGTGWRTWTVTAHVQAMYSGSNYGFLLRDQTETGGSSKLQRYTSREGAANDPELIVTWG